MSSKFFTIFACMLLPSLHLTWANKPEIQAFPSKVIRKGDNIIIRCSSTGYQGIFRLHKENPFWFMDGDKDVYEQNFTVTNVQEQNSNDYYCQQASNNVWSDRSDVLTLQVIDMSKPNISACLQNNTDQIHLLITCTAPDPSKKYRIKRFALHSGSEPSKDLSVNNNSPEVTFNVSNLLAEYRCSYSLQVEQSPPHFIESPLSDSVTSTKCDVSDPRIIVEYDYDYTRTNIVRLLLAAALIILACGFVIEYWIDFIKD